MLIHRYSLSTLAVAAAAAVSAFEGEERPDATPSDIRITTEVKTELAAAENVKIMDVEVNTVDGNVIMRGVLGSDSDIRKAIAVARGVKGVKDVEASQLTARTASNTHW
jgi:hyperosmotically inducible periplasmic protein